MEVYADIIVDITHEKLDRIFQYRIPEELAEDVHVGCQVVVPFGMGNRQITGYCIGVSYETDYDPDKIKNILSIKEKSTSMESKQILLADFMKRRYGVTMIQALKTVLPVKQSVKNVVQKHIVRTARVLRYHQGQGKSKGEGSVVGGTVAAGESSL